VRTTLGALADALAQAGVTGPAILFFGLAARQSSGIFASTRPTMNFANKSRNDPTLREAL